MFGTPPRYHRPRADDPAALAGQQEGGGEAGSDSESDRGGDGGGGDGDDGGFGGKTIGGHAGLAELRKALLPTLLCAAAGVCSCSYLYRNKFSARFVHMKSMLGLPGLEATGYARLCIEK
eukprot:COSAG06_NODE_4350_length_4342_cov_1.776337_3_plen_120_part_00